MTVIGACCYCNSRSASDSPVDLDCLQLIMYIVNVIIEAPSLVGSMATLCSLVCPEGA